MTQLIFTTKDLKPNKVNKAIHKLTLEDFIIVNFNILGVVQSILFIDEITKLTHTIR